MKRASSGAVVPLLLVLVVLVVQLQAARIAVLTPSDGLVQAVSFAAQNVYSLGIINTTVVSSLNIDYVRLGGTAYENLQAAQAAALIPGTALAIVDTDDESIGAVFDALDIPVVWVNSASVSHDGWSNLIHLGNLPPRALAAAALVRHFGWRNMSLIYAPAYQDAAASFVAAAMQNGATVLLNATLDFNFPVSVFSDVILSLERSRSRVVVVIGPPPLAELILKTIEDTLFEFVFFDPFSENDRHADLNATNVLDSPVPGLPRGFFILSIEQNFTNRAYLEESLIALNRSLFTVPLPRLVTAAVDAVHMYANAVASLHAEGGNISSGPSIHNKIITAPISYVTNHVFDPITQHCAGGVRIWNFQVNKWFNGSQWVSIGNWNGPAGISIGDPSALMFADGSAVPPSAAQDAIVSIGLMWPTSRPLYGAWQLIAAMAIDNMNNAAILPSGYKFKTVFSDNFDSVSGTVISGMDLLARGAIGVVGPARSGQSIALQYYYGGLRIPQISMGSTIDSLSDKLNYPTFFRTVMKDSFQSITMAYFIEHMKWRSFCIIYDNSDYSAGIASNLESKALSLGLRVAARGVYSLISPDFRSAFNPVVSSGCRVIVGILDMYLFADVMTAAKSRNLFGENHPEYVWIFSETISSDLNTERILMNNFTVRDFHGTLLAKPVDGDPADPLYQSFVTDVSALLAPHGYVMPPYNTLLYDAMWMLGLAAGQMVSEGKNLYSDRISLLTNLRSISFNGVSGPVSFDSNQDRIGAIYGMYNFRSEIADVVEVATYSNQTGIVFSLENTIVFGDNTSVIPSDSSPVPFVAILFASGGAGVITAVACIVLTLLLSSSIFIVWQTTTRAKYEAADIIRKSSPMFLHIILFGLALAVMSVFFWFASTNSGVGPAVCHFRVWFAFTGAAMAYAALLAKNWRLYFLFNEPSLRGLAIRNRQLLGALAAVLAPLIVVLVLWSALAPFQYEIQLNAVGTIGYWACISTNDKVFQSISFAYMGVLFLVGAALSWKTRTLPDTFKESNYIALSTYNLIFVSAIGILVGHLVSYDPPAYTLIIAVCILFCAVATWALIFVPKFYVMKYGWSSALSHEHTNGPKPTVFTTIDNTSIAVKTNRSMLDTSLMTSSMETMALSKLRSAPAGFVPSNLDVQVSSSMLEDPAYFHGKSEEAEEDEDGIDEYVEEGMESVDANSNDVSDTDEEKMEPQSAPSTSSSFKPSKPTRKDKKRVYRRDSRSSKGSNASYARSKRSNLTNSSSTDDADSVY